MHKWFVGVCWCLQCLS